MERISERLYGVFVESVIWLCEMGPSEGREARVMFEISELGASREWLRVLSEMVITGGVW